MFGNELIIPIKSVPQNVIQDLPCHDVQGDNKTG